MPSWIKHCSRQIFCALVDQCAGNSIALAWGWSGGEIAKSGVKPMEKPSPSKGDRPGLVCRRINFTNTPRPSVICWPHHLVTYRCSEGNVALRLVPPDGAVFRYTQRYCTDYFYRKSAQIWGAMINYSLYFVCATIFCRIGISTYHIRCNLVKICLIFLLFGQICSHNG